MKIFYPLIIMLLMAFGAQSQTRPGSSRIPEDRMVKFYPNPAITQISFDFKAYSKNYSFQIFNFIGKKVYELSSVTSAKTTVDLSDYFRGVYIFQLKDQNGKIIEAGKFQVSK
ncbi:MAG: T9SS type A sorting domain-containing protein [Chitinophagaceae bacterium]|nr:T9SS type A sorting domain-containing protein [Chitinophagaceae bacterium]